MDGTGPRPAEQASGPSIAHGAHEKRIGAADPAGWPEWYAAWMVAEQAGKPLPT